MAAPAALAEGYADDPDGRRNRRLAQSFRPDERLEAQLEQSRSDPDAFARLPLPMRVAVGHYAEAKRAVESIEQAEQ